MSAELSTDLGFNPSILAETNAAYAEKPKMPERLKLLGVKLILDSKLNGRPTTRKLAEQLETTETTLFRYTGKPARPFIYNLGINSIFNEHRTPRYAALKSLALDLVAAPELSSTDAVSLWTRAYAKTANPGYIFQAIGLHATHGKDMIDTNALLIDSCLGAIATTRGETIPVGLGLQLTPLFGAYDATPVTTVETHFPDFAEQVVLERLTA